MCLDGAVTVATLLSLANVRVVGPVDHHAERSCTTRECRQTLISCHNKQKAPKKGIQSLVS